MMVVFKSTVCKLIATVSGIKGYLLLKLKKTALSQLLILC